MLSSHSLEIALAALYLPGLERPHDPTRNRWPVVEHVLRRAGAPEDGLESVLRDAGLHEEAFVLASPSLVFEARALLEKRRALTAVSPGYPPLLALRHGPSAPPAFWAHGPLPSAPFLAVVGSRCPSSGAARFAREIVAVAHHLGLGIASGGAPGCDRIVILQAARLAIPHVEFLPCGFGMGFGFGECQLSAVAPGAEFSAAAAMERNALVYGSAVAAVVIQPRFKQGGTWLGAISALRRRLCPVIVWMGEESRAARALCALGAIPIPSSTGLAAALSAPPDQQSLPYSPRLGV